MIDWHDADLSAGEPAAVPGAGHPTAPPADPLVDRPLPAVPGLGLRILPLPRQLVWPAELVVALVAYLTNVS